MASARGTGSMDSLKKSIQKSIQKSIDKSLRGPMKDEIEELGAMSTAFTEKLSESAKSAKLAAEQAKSAAETGLQTAQSAAQTATQLAKLTALNGLDQMLVSLEHRGVKIKESQDMIQKLGQAVLGRAETIRAQIAENPLAPDWLKEMSLAQPTATSSAAAKASAKAEKTAEHVPAEAAGSMSESSVSTVAEEMVTEPMSDVLEQEHGHESAAVKGAAKARKKTSRTATSH